MAEQFKLMFDDEEKARGTIGELMEYIHDVHKYSHKYSFNYAVSEGGYKLESLEAEVFMMALDK